MIKDYGRITISALLIALAVTKFIAMHQLTPGGITGLSIVVNMLTGVPLQYVTLMITIPLLGIGTLVLGQSYGLKTLYISIMTPFFIGLFEMEKAIAGPVLSGICGGILVGTGIGLALWADCSTGGTDLIAQLINRFVPVLSVPAALFALDTVTVLSSSVLTKDYMNSVYSFLTLAVIIYTIKLVLALKEGRFETVFNGS